MADTSVVLFDSSMSGAPVITGATPGTILAALVACLVDGFGSKSLSSLAVSDGLATAIVSAGHLFSNYVSGSGVVLEISGATPPELNGRVRAEVVNSTTLTWPVASADVTASGSMSAKRAPAGWTKPFAATNKAVLRNAPSPDGTGWSFLVANEVATWGYLNAYKTMSDISTGTRRSNTATLLNASGSSAASPAWACIADNRTCHILIVDSGSTIRNFMSFGDFLPASSLDVDSCYVGGYGCLVSLLTDFDAASIGSTPADARIVLASGRLDQVSRVGMPVYGLMSNTGLSGTGVFLPGTGSGDLPFPNALTGQLDVSRISLAESGSVRGALRGIYAPQHKYTGLTDIAYLLPDDRIGKRMLIESTYSANRYGALMVDLTGPW